MIQGVVSVREGSTRSFVDIILDLIYKVLVSIHIKEDIKATRKKVKLLEDVFANP